MRIIAFVAVFAASTMSNAQWTPQKLSQLETILMSQSADLSPASQGRIMGALTKLKIGRSAKTISTVRKLLDSLDKLSPTELSAKAKDKEFLPFIQAAFHTFDALGDYTYRDKAIKLHVGSKYLPGIGEVMPGAPLASQLKLVPFWDSLSESKSCIGLSRAQPEYLEQVRVLREFVETREKRSPILDRALLARMFELRQYALGLRYVSACAKIRNDYPVGLAEVAAEASHGGDLEVSEKASQLLLTLVTAKTPYWDLRIRATVMAGKLKDAEALFEKEVAPLYQKFEPGYLFALKEYVSGLQILGESSKIASLAQRFPKDALHIAGAQAKAMVSVGNAEKAAEFLKPFPANYYRLEEALDAGLVLLAASDYEASFEKLDPHNRFFLARRIGELAISKGDVNTARKYLLKANEVAVANPAPTLYDTNHYDLTWRLAQVGELDAAKAAHSRVKDSKPLKYAELVSDGFWRAFSNGEIRLR